LHQHADEKGRDRVVTGMHAWESLSVDRSEAVALERRRAHRFHERWHQNVAVTSSTQACEPEPP